MLLILWDMLLGAFFEQMDHEAISQSSGLCSLHLVVIAKVFRNRWHDERNL